MVSPDRTDIGVQLLLAGDLAAALAEAPVVEHHHVQVQFAEGVQVDEPLLHGDKDELIGLHHSVALRKAAPHAQFHCVEGAGHSDVHQFPSFRKAVNAALGTL